MDGAMYGDCSEWVTEELRPEHICTRCKKPRLFVTTQVGMCLMSIMTWVCNYLLNYSETEWHMSIQDKSRCIVEI